MYFSDACKDMTPPCGAMDTGTTKSALVPGQEFCMCSSLEVPSIAPPGVSDISPTFSDLIPELVDK